MTTSDLRAHPPEQVFVWIWLPEATEPVVCGRLDQGSPITFTYAQSYKNREDAVAVFEPELPLTGMPPLQPLDGDGLPLCIDDAMPDSWGRRLVNYRLGAGFAELSELTYLVASGSDRIGALDFQLSSTEYVPRDPDSPTLDELADAARRIEAGEPVPERLMHALLHGTSIGGARPKALLRDGDRSLIAKFSSMTDTYPVVQGEFVAMTLARRCGLNVAPVSLVEAHKRHALVGRTVRPAWAGPSEACRVGAHRLGSQHLPEWTLCHVQRSCGQDSPLVHAARRDAAGLVRAHLVQCPVR